MGDLDGDRFSKVQGLSESLRPLIDEDQILDEATLRKWSRNASKESTGSRGWEKIRASVRSASKSSVGDASGVSGASGEIDSDQISNERHTLDVTVRDNATNDLLATVNGLPNDGKISTLLTAICREAGLPCRPQLYWGDKAIAPWCTLEECGIPDGAELPCDVQQSLVSASHDGLAKIWNMETGECETTLTGHDGKVLMAIFSPNGRFVVTASEDKTAKVWSTLSGKCERTLHHSDAVYCASWSSDGKFVTTASEDRTAKVWTVKTGDCRATLRGHTGAVYSSHFTEDESQVVTESRDGTTKLWNPKTGICNRTLEEQAEVYACSYSPCGQHVATTPGDFTALILNVVTGECELTLIGHDDLVIAVSYCPQRLKQEPPKAKRDSALTF